MCRTFRCPHSPRANFLILERGHRAKSDRTPRIIDIGDPMDKTIRKVIDLAEQRAETYRYWRSRPSSERFEATYRHSVDLYRQKGIVSNGEGSRSFARIQRKKS